MRRPGPTPASYGRRCCRLLPSNVRLAVIWRCYNKITDPSAVAGARAHTHYATPRRRLFVCSLLYSYARSTNLTNRPPPLTLPEHHKIADIMRAEEVNRYLFTLQHVTIAVDFFITYYIYHTYIYSSKMLQTTSPACHAVRLARP